jgi:hypothetical protein
MITFVEKFSGLSCISKIFDSKYYDFGMTRDDKGTVSLYLNNANQAFVPGTRRNPSACIYPVNGCA